MEAYFKGTYGVSAIDKTTTPTRTFANWLGNTLSLSPRVRITNANSPPPDSSNPVLMLSLLVRPKIGPKQVVMTALKNTNPLNRAITYVINYGKRSD